MKEYVIKFQGYYLRELDEGSYHCVLKLEDATTFGSVRTALYTLDEYFKLNLASVEIVEVTTVIKEMPMSQCSVCGELVRNDELECGVVDRETGVEYFCTDCHEDADLIIGNQALDELEVLECLTMYMKKSK